MTIPLPVAETPRDSDARIKALLDERSVALARRGASEAALATRSILLCLCGPDRYGLSLDSVAQVIPARHCTRVPGASAAVVGLAGLSGRVVSVIALAAAMGGHARHVEGYETEQPSGHFVVLKGAGAAFALAVDRVEGVVEIPVDAIDPPPGKEGTGLGSAAVSVYAATGSSNEVIVLVDTRRLLRRYRP